MNLKFELTNPDYIYTQVSKESDLQADWDEIKSEITHVDVKFKQKNFNVTP